MMEEKYDEKGRVIYRKDGGTEECWSYNDDEHSSTSIAYNKNGYSMLKEFKIYDEKDRCVYRRIKDDKSNISSEWIEYYHGDKGVSVINDKFEEINTVYKDKNHTEFLYRVTRNIKDGTVFEEQNSFDENGTKKRYTNSLGETISYNEDGSIKYSIQFYDGLTIEESDSMNVIYRYNKDNTLEKARYLFKKNGHIITIYPEYTEDGKSILKIRFDKDLSEYIGIKFDPYAPL